jgi:putative acetyltransferase
MIRKHTLADQDKILDIWYQSSVISHAFLDKYFVAQVKLDMKNIYIPGSDTWVFTEGEEKMGFISMVENEIVGLFVSPDQQSKGIGSKLVDFIIKKHKEIEVEVFEKNDIGRAFYKKYGFRFMKKYYHQESKQELLRLKYKG